jgi:hypothetical protein
MVGAADALKEGEGKVASYAGADTPGSVVCFGELTMPEGPPRHSTTLNPWWFRV